MRIADHRARGQAATLLLSIGWSWGVAGDPPPTAVKPVEETYHGVVVTDPYRWLENAADPAVQAWVDAQNRHAREHLDRLPGLDRIRSEVTAILRAPGVSYSAIAVAGGQIFALKRQPPRQQPFLVVMPSADRPEEARVVVDPEKLDPAGSVAIDWYVPAPDGATLAVSLSRDGTEAGDVHLFDVASGAATGEVVPGVNGGTAGGSLAWAPAGDGFFYTRYPRPGERPSQDAAFFVRVFHHELGADPTVDRYEIGADFPRIAEIELKPAPDSAHLLATVQDGDGGRFAHYLRSPDGQWRQIAGLDDGIQQVEFGPGQELYLISRKDAPRGKLLRLAIADPVLSAAQPVVPEQADTLVSTFWGAPSVLASGDSILATYQLGGPSEIRLFDRGGRRLLGPQQDTVSSVGGMVAIEPGIVLFARSSYLEPTVWHRFEIATAATRPTALRTEAPARFDDCEVTREFAVSKDGTRVPVNILRRRGLLLDASHPCLVTGYGGYGVSLNPGFQPLDRILLDRGFVLAEANLRGGGEFGEEWHRAGNLTLKQNVFDDFIAVLEHMIRRGYTRPERLGIIGGSNGGLLMGAALTQRPDLMRAVVSSVGIYDMLRVELSPNGAFNVTEFGSVKDPEQFRALHAYSPYHHVARDRQYPAVLLLAGANDPRVDPMQSRKMAAALQATAGGAPVLLRTSGATGHGGDTPLDERIEERVDVFAFLLAQLGVTAGEGAQRVVELGSRLELFVDDFLTLSDADLYALSFGR